MQRLSFAALVAAFCVSATQPLHAADEATLARGQYLAAIMDCGGCHTPNAMGPTGPDMSRHLAGSDVGFEIPGLGVFFPPNLTSAESGIGTWSEAEILAAVVEGRRPDGRELMIMPWRSYAALTAEDGAALAAYLKSLAPIESPRLGPYGPGDKVPAPYLAIVLPQ